jgi:putative peptidoglycan lipid II flippase
MLRITFPYLLLISLTAFSGAILNHYNKFAIPAFTPVLLNISIILSAIYLSKYFETSIISLAWGVLIGGILQLAFQIPFLMQIKKIPKLTYSNHPVIKLVKKRMIPAMFGTSISQINLLIDTVIASTLISGSISWLYHSDRLLELPLALIGIALATVALTKLSKYFASKDEEKFTYIVNYAIKIGIILGIPSSVGLLLLSESLIITLFQYGEFNAFDSKQSAKSLLAYSCGLIAFIVVKILASAFLARGDTKTPVKAGIIAMIVNIILNLILVQFLFHVGLALSTSIAAFINATILYYYLHKKSIFKISSNLIKLFFKILIASFIMGMFILFYSQNIDYSSINMLNRAIEIIITIMFSIMIYFIALWILRVKINKL